MKAGHALMSVLLTAVTTEARRLAKRDFYTCYETAPSAINATDCGGVIAEVRSRTGAFSLVSDLCLLWMHGSCMARLCAVDDDTETAALNQSYAWVGDRLDSLQQDCASHGQDGMRGDCGNLNGYCGTYRLFLEHRGQTLNISGAGVA